MSKPISILIFIDSLGCGGAEKSLVSLLPFLAGRNYEITLMVRACGGLFECYVPKNVKLIQFPFKPNKFRQLLFSMAIRMPWNKKRHTEEIYWEIIGADLPSLKLEYDVAIAYQQGFPTFYISDKVSARNKICWINADLDAMGFSHKFCSRFYKTYNSIVAVSKILSNDIIYPDYCDDKSRIVTCFDILNVKIIDKLSKVSNPFYGMEILKIVTVGRLSSEKGYDLAIEAAKILKNKGIEFRWYFIGDGPLCNEINDKIQKNDLNNYVILTGLQANPYPYIANCDIYVQPSRFEGFGITVGEAKILCKPIVCTNFKVVYNQIEDHKNGLIVNMSSKDIADGIIELVNDKKLRDALINSLKTECNNTSVTESAKVIRLIESVV